MRKKRFHKLAVGSLILAIGVLSYFQIPEIKIDSIYKFAYNKLFTNKTDNINGYVFDKTFTLDILENNKSLEKYTAISLDDIPTYNGDASVIINKNIPFFKDEEITTKEFEKYSSLDKSGRCTQAYLNVSPKTMPTEERGSIGNIRPTGWDYNGKSNNNKYPDLIEDRYIYNRCHLAAFCLSGENDNKENLITGTRYMNLAMLPYEEKVAKYVEETNNHVLYRSTPIFEDDNQIASGILIEAYSVEDKGKGIQFCVYCYNVQPGITINYKTGENGKSSK